MHNKFQYCFNQTSEKLITDFSKVYTPGVYTEPGYYGLYVDHPPSDSVKLSDQDSKPVSEELPRIKQISIIKSDQPKSVDLYYPKLADYRESKQNIFNVHIE